MKKGKLIFRVLLILIIYMCVSTGMHIIGSIVQGSHGAPTFLTVPFVVFGIISSLLLIVSYILIGYRIPVKNRILRGTVYIFLFWISDYFSQILGMTGAESPILSSDALSVTTILFDTMGYFAMGILLGLFLDVKADTAIRKCSGKKLVLACLVSAVLFSGLAFGLEMLFGSMNHNLLGYVLFGIREDQKISYYVVFYLCQSFSGLLFSIFYRLTEYNSEHTKKWLYFASVYGLMLWAPIVLIVTFFGIPVLPTILFTVILVTSIYIDSVVFSYILE